MEHVFEIIANYETPGQVLAKLWWDGKAIKSDNKKAVMMLRHITIHNRGQSVTFKDGPAFLNALPHHFRNGYMSVRKVDG